MPFSFVQITDHHLRETETALTSGYSTAYAFRSVMRPSPHDLGKWRSEDTGGEAQEGRVMARNLASLAFKH